MRRVVYQSLPHLFPFLNWNRISLNQLTTYTCTCILLTLSYCMWMKMRETRTRMSDTLDINATVRLSWERIKSLEYLHSTPLSLFWNICGWIHNIPLLQFVAIIKNLVKSWQELTFTFEAKIYNVSFLFIDILHTAQRVYWSQMKGHLVTIINTLETVEMIHSALSVYSETDPMLIMSYI